MPNHLPVTSLTFINAGNVLKVLPDVGCCAALIHCFMFCIICATDLLLCLNAFVIFVINAFLDPLLGRWLELKNVFMSATRHASKLCMTILGLSSEMLLYNCTRDAMTLFLVICAIVVYCGCCFIVLCNADTDIAGCGAVGRPFGNIMVRRTLMSVFVFSAVQIRGICEAVVVAVVVVFWGATFARFWAG